MTGTAHSYSEWIPIMATITATGTLDDLIIEEMTHVLEGDATIGVALICIHTSPIAAYNGTTANA